MKQLFSFLLLSILCAFISTANTTKEIQREAVITLDSSINPQIHHQLIKDFTKIDGVSYCDASLQTKTVIIQYDENKFHTSDVNNILNKWGCKAKNMSFTYLSEFIE